ncbi:uncharacterized protein B0H18DRAFT_969244, partial [Fomitopsis serialis]|uniref:uncharacterized protein n=1 Tax=Fomitopsis serialis TaxID=139415 RepID=UPI002008AFF4
LVMDIKKSAKAGQMNACKVMAKDLVRTSATSRNSIRCGHSCSRWLRIQTLRSNQQMAEAMRGATRAMGAMNRADMNEFERESATMDMKEEMMSDAVDDVMDDDLEGEEEEGDKILKQVLDEIGVDLSQQLSDAPSGLAVSSSLTEPKQPVALGDAGGSSHHGPGGDSGAGGGGGGGMSDEDALQARLDALRRG